jgi:general secretion pathway protein A
MSSVDLRAHFGCHTVPYTREIPVEQRYELPDGEEAVRALLAVIEQRMSAALIGPAGTGKTVVLRTIRAHLPAARYNVHYVKVTSLSKRDMCREIASCVGARSAGSFPTLVRNLQEHCTQLAEADGLRPVLLIDEGHDIRSDVLGILKILTNFEMDSRLVLSVIIAGQPQLRTLLKRDDTLDVARRLAHIATLRTMTRQESERYLHHRCTIAGASTIPFSTPATDAIFEIARGNFRATDRLALKAMEVAARLDLDVVDASHVVESRRLLWP